MQFRNTLIALIILLALGTYVYFFERGKSPEEAKEKAKLLVEFDREKVTGIELTSKEITIICSKDKAGNWQITSPLKTKADKSALEDLISDLKDLKATRIIKEDIGDWKDYGLSTPEVKLTLKLGEEGSKTIYWGNKNPTETSVYARLLERDYLYLVPAWKKDHFKKELFDLRDKTVISLDKEQVKKIELQRKDEKPTVISRESEKRWRISSPITTYADKDEIDNLLEKLAELKVKKFIDQPEDNASAYGLDTPYLKLVLWLGDDMASKSLLIGKEASDEDSGRKYARRAGEKTVLLLENSDIDDIDKKLFDLCFKQAFDFDNNEKVTKLEILYPDRKIICQKTDSQQDDEDTTTTWQITAPEEVKADTASINTFLWDLQDLKAERFVAETCPDPSVYGLDKPQLKIALYLKDNLQSPQVLSIGKIYEKKGKKQARSLKKTDTEKDKDKPGKDGSEEAEEETLTKNMVYAQTSLFPAVFLLEAEKIKDLKKTAFDFRDKKFFTFERDKVYKLELIYPEQTLVCLKKAEDQWQLIEPEKTKVKSYEVSDIFWELEYLKYTSEPIEAGKDMERFGLKKPQVQIKLKDKKDKVINYLVLGKVTKDDETKAYARVGDSTIVYPIDASKLDTLTKSITDLKED